MRKHASLGLALSVICSIAAVSAHAQERPAWITDQQIALLRQLGVDPIADVVTRGTYHWTWQVNRRLAVGAYHCPVGSNIDISRSIMVVRAPKDSPCGGSSGFERVLKLSPDGSAEPLAGSDKG
jgi:hypothetical protein